MKKSKFLTTFFILVSVLNLMSAQAAGLLAFPGAEGFGRFAPGGRGGTIYHVTNLNDSGTGSFRDAISSSNRIIVFDVSGVIKVKVGDPLIFSKNLTVLGQTAPGEGIQVYGERVSFSGADNIIVRYMRIRMGIGGTSGKDAAGVANGKNMIFDHMSVLWGRDETFSISWDSKGTEPSNITIQNSIMGQGLQTHSCGGLIQTSGGVTLFRNLYIENKTRNPKVKGLNQYVNNVVYNWGNGGCYIMGGSEGDSWAQIENNYFINGPWEGAAGVFTSGTPTFTYYANGNFHDGDEDGVLDGTLMTSDQYSGSTVVNNFDTWDNSSTRPQAHPYINSMKSAKDALAWIIDSVGPCLPVRDQVDDYLIDEVKSYGKKGTTGGITTEKTLPHGGTGTLYGGYKPTDTDGDAIPDTWETANGLNPNNAADASAIAANGYANIENYANSITAAYPYIKSPSGLKSIATTTTSIDLSWTDNSSDETGFVIEMSTNGTTYTVLETLPANTVSYQKAGLAKETVHYFRVKAINETLYSPYSSVLSIKTKGDPAIPFACTDPTPNNGGTFGISNTPRLSWSNATNIYGGTIYYSFFFGYTPETLTLLKDSITTSYYTIDTTKTGSLIADTTYYWRVDTKNTMGSTTGTVWSFSTVAGGTLFTTDFHYTPTSFYDAYGKNTANTDIFSTSATASSTKTYSGMVLGNGPNQVRIAWLPQGAPTSTTSDYGPYTEADAGSTAGCVQFVTEKSGAYVKFPEVQGPCVITMWTGNTSAASRTFNLNFIIGAIETTATSFTMAAAKRAFKFKYTYTGSEKVNFKIDANAKKINVNDVLIEAFVPEVSSDPIAFNTTPDSTGVSYADGAMSFTLNQSIKYNGGATINGDQFEQISVTGSGSSLNVAYVGLDANTNYTISFPSGSLTDFYGTKTNDVDFSFTTCDFPATKVSGEIHFGKAALALPLNFKPFNVTAPFQTVADSVQTKYGDYPHWITAAGGVTADSVIMTSTSDKLMSYFNGRSGSMRVKAYFSGTGSVTFKVQETRNSDVAPGWRTIRQLTTTDFPIDEDFALNSETRFTKIVPVSISTGSVIIKELQLSDASGNYSTSITEVYKDLGIRAFTSTGNLIIKGTTPGMLVEVFDVTGKSIVRQSAHKETVELGLPKGFYLIRISEGNASQLLKTGVL